MRQSAAESPLRVFGAMLAYYRARAGMTPEQLGERIYLSGSQIRKVEAGTRTPTEDLAKACESLPELGCNGALTELPPLVKYLTDSRGRVIDAVESLGRFSDATQKTADSTNTNLNRNLVSLQRPLAQLVRAAPYVVPALKVALTAPFDIDAVPKTFRGDFINTSLNVDLTLSALDNGLLTGTRFTGALRALEQSWGRDPATMIPDVRFTPNPNDAPGGPLVERGP